MAIIKTVSVNYERKINMGNYQSATVGVSIFADIELDPEGMPLEDEKEVLSELWETAKTSALAQVDELRNGA